MSVLLGNCSTSRGPNQPRMKYKREWDYDRLAHRIRTGQVSEVSLTSYNKGLLWELFAALQQSSTVTSFSLVRTPLGQENAELLIHSLVRSPITSLSLTDNSVVAEELGILIPGLQGTRITDLGLAVNSMGDAGLQVLVRGLPSLKLRTLRLCKNSFGLEGIQALSAGLRGSSVTSLDLFGNHLLDAGAKLLAEALPQTSVKILDLSHNSIGDAGMIALAQSLQASSVARLWLAGNLMEDAGAQAFAEAFRGSLVSSLNVSNNQIGEEGGQALLQAVRETLRVTQLCLIYNQCSDQTLDAIKEAVEGNEARRSSFILQMEVKSLGPVYELTFRTMSGAVAAVLPWCRDAPLDGLQDAIITAMAQSQKETPFHKAACQLNILLVDGVLLDLGPFAKPLAQQLERSLTSLEEGLPLRPRPKCKLRL